MRNLVVDTAKVGAAGGLDANVTATANLFAGEVSEQILLRSERQ